jgi:ATP-dependent DNA ligase
LLTPVGVVGAFPMARRRAMFAELQALVAGFGDHPWRWAADMASGSVEGGSRWNANQDWSFVPLRPERVVEVRYDYFEGFRFRHTAQFVRWRPDRDAASCGFDQVERPAGFDLAAVFAG